MGPANDATPWKPWLKLSRAAAYFGLPRIEMYELAATSSVHRPQPVRLLGRVVSPKTRERTFGRLAISTHQSRTCNQQTLRTSRTLLTARRKSRLWRAETRVTLFMAAMCDGTLTLTLTLRVRREMHRTDRVQAEAQMDSFLATMSSATLRTVG